jgi:hypothetical protein
MGFQQTIQHLPSLALVRSYKVNNIKFIKILGFDGVETEHAIIDHGNGSFTSMLKSTYEAQQAAQAYIPTTIIPD